MTSIEGKEEQKNGAKNIKIIQDYKKTIESELNLYCQDILDLIDNNIIQSCSNSESKVFFLKMQGDYYRYISEYAKDS